MTAPNVTTPNVTTPNVTLAPPPGCEPGGQWLPLTDHGFSKYAVWSRGGQGRDQRPVRRTDTGQLMAVSVGTQNRHRPSARRPGYLRTKIRNDHGAQKTVEVHALIMLANVGPPKPGQQTRHLDGDPWNNRWEPGDETGTKAAGGNMVYGTGADDHRDQVDAGSASPPPATFPCLNACGGMTRAQGVRCEPCRITAGTRANALLTDGVPLPVVTRKLGFTSEAHVHALARQYGGYRGTIAQARAQKQTLRRRITRWFRRGDHK